MIRQFIIEKYSEYIFTVHTFPSKQRQIGHIVSDISCGWVYVAGIECNSNGFYSAEFLRGMADKLDELNATLFKEWSDEAN